MQKFSLLCLIVLALPFGVAAQEEVTFNLDETHPLPAAGRLLLVSDDARVSISASKRQDIALQVRFRARPKGIKLGDFDFRVEATEADGTLIIKEVVSGNPRVIGKLEKDYRIDLQLPASLALEIRGDDDHYRIAGMGGTLNLTADDARVQVENFEGEKIDLRLDDGEAQFHNCRGALTARLDDADLKITAGAFSRIDTRGDDGTIYAENSLLSNTLIKFSGDNNNIYLVITRGGGTFRIQYKRSKLNYGPDFRMTGKDATYTTLSLAGGRGKVVIAGDNIKVTLVAPGAK